MIPRHNNVSLNFIRKHEPLLLKSEELTLYQILINIVSNAIDSYQNDDKSDKKHVDVKAYQENKNIIIQIIDYGSGMTPSQLKQIFKPFFTTKDNGCGIGLHSTKKLIKQINAKLDIESSVGAGSTFTITLKK